MCTYHQRRYGTTSTLNNNNKKEIKQTQYYYIFACLHSNAKRIMKQQVDKRNDYCFFFWRKKNGCFACYHFTHLFSFLFSNFEYAWMCVFFCSRCAGVHFSMPTHALALALTHFLVNVLWQCFFEVSIFVATYCSSETHTQYNTYIHPLWWLFQPNFRFCRLLRIQELAQRENNREKKEPFIYTGFGFQLIFIANKTRMFVVSFHFSFFSTCEWVCVFACIYVWKRSFHFSSIYDNTYSKASNTYVTQKHTHTLTCHIPWNRKQHPIKIGIARNTSGKAYTFILSVKKNVINILVAKKAQRKTARTTKQWVLNWKFSTHTNCNTRCEWDEDEL